MRTLSTTALGALVFFCAVATVKADFDPVDCSSTAFAFSDAAYNVDCERSKDPLRVGQSSGSSVTDVMTVSSEDRTIFVTMLSRVITAPRIYMEHRGLGENFRALFNEEGVQDWKSIGNKDGYDVAEFSGRSAGATPAVSPCSAIPTPRIPATSGTSSAWDARSDSSRASISSSGTSTRRAIEAPVSSDQQSPPPHS